MNESSKNHKDSILFRENEMKGGSKDCTSK